MRFAAALAGMQLGTWRTPPRGAPAIAFAALILNACEPGASVQNERVASQPAPALAAPEAVQGLGMHGYNYTDMPISSYLVSGAGWGGDVRVSNMTSGGSKTTCCASVPNHLPITYLVEWSRDDRRWCEMSVIFNGPIPKNPFNFNTHFYKDGHIEISISSDYEGPRVKLPSVEGGVSRKQEGNIVLDEQVARCKDAR